MSSNKSESELLRAGQVEAFSRWDLPSFDSAPHQVALERDQPEPEPEEQEQPPEEEELEEVKPFTVEELEQIRKECLRVDGVLGVHQLRTRMSGPTRFIQLHLELDDNLRLIDAHQIADKVEDNVLSLFPDADVLIHQDPLSVVFGPEREQKAQDW